MVSNRCLSLSHPTAENNELSRQLEDAENKCSQMSRSKTLLLTQHEELKKQFDEEVKVSNPLEVLVTGTSPGNIFKKSIIKSMALFNQ